MRWVWEDSVMELFLEFQPGVKFPMFEELTTEEVEDFTLKHVRDFIRSYRADRIKEL